MSRTAYVDADMVIYTALAHTQDVWDGVACCDVSRAEAEFDRVVRLWTEKLDINDTILCLTDRGNEFRKTLAPDYKAKRPVSKPAGFDELLEIVTNRSNVLKIPLLEADDVIGIRCSHRWDEAVAISKDKDFLTVPCAFFNPSKMKRPLIITEEQADHTWMKQTMIGDPIDNYKGIPKIGEKKASAILPHPSPVEILWPRVVKAFVHKGLTEEDALLNARLARILRREDYDPNSGPILWSPTPNKKS